MSFLNNSSSKSSLDVFLENNQIHLFCSVKEEINEPNEYGWTPLYRALVSNNIEAMKELLKEGADPNIPNNMNETPLYQAIDNENEEAMLLLLENNANCNICKSDGNSPLHLAIKKLAVTYIGPLLNKGANPNLKNKLYQQTPLHLAIKSKLDISIIKQLYEHNADFNIKDKYDCIPMDYCDDSTYKNEINNLINLNNSIISKVNENQNESNTLNNNYSIKQSNEQFLGDDNQGNYNLKYSSKTETDNSKPNTLVQNINCTLSSEHQIRKNNTFNIYNNNILANKQSPSQFNKLQKTTSTFNLSTPNKTNRYCYHNQNESNSAVDKDVISEINPLDLINQVITTTNNSNIFSELQNNTQDLHQDEDIKLNNNQFDNTLQENDLTYSKSKSYIVTELPLTSKKKQPHYSGNEPNNSDFIVEREKDVINNNNNNIYHSKVNINYKSGIVHVNHSNQKKISQIQNRNDENKENNINVGNVSTNTNNYLYIEDNNNNNSNNNNLKYYYPNKNEINSSYGGGDILYNSNFVYGCDISNSSHHEKEKEMQTFSSNRNTSNMYSNTSTRPGTLHNSNCCKTTYNYNSNRSSNDNNKNAANFTNIHTYNIGVASLSSNISPKLSSHSKYKKSSILSNYSYRGHYVPKLFYEDNSPSSNHNTIDINNNMTANNETKIIMSSYNAKRLHEWLLNCDLLRYYNILIEQGIDNIDKCIQGIQSGDLNLTYRDIEDIGIKKPGHIYRFLLKLHCDAGLIDNRIVKHIFPNKIEHNEVHLGTSQYFCGCSMVEKKSIKEYDVESWLRSKSIYHLKDNFIHNGFDIFEYIIIQLFSSFIIDDSFLVERMHIYNGNDRYKLKKALNNERKILCKKLGHKYIDIEQEEENKDRIEQCEVCTLF